MGEPPKAAISVCILAGHGSAHLERCLAGLHGQQDAPPFELLIGGNPDEVSRAAARRLFPGAQICDTGRRLPGGARNPLVQRAEGDIVLFLDDDVVPSRRLLRTLAELAARHPEAAVFGGPNATPRGSSLFQLTQGAVLSSLLGSGPVSRRYGARGAGYADERWFTLCNLAVRREVMRPFADELVCAEENALLAQLRSHGELMLYDPSLCVYHQRRPDLRSFAQQIVKYGRGRGQLSSGSPGTLRPAFLAPSLLLLYLAVLTVALSLGAPVVVSVPALLYAALVAAMSLKIAFALRRVSAAGLAALLLLSLHACYGVGVVRGFTGRGRSEVDRSSAHWWTSHAENG